LFFCFSIRRRHTRSKRDWSSDVCSSDLNYAIEPSSFPFSVFIVHLGFPQNEKSIASYTNKKFIIVSVGNSNKLYGERANQCSVSIFLIFPINLSRFVSFILTDFELLVTYLQLLIILSNILAISNLIIYINAYILQTKHI